MEFMKLAVLKIYTAEDEVLGNMPFYKAIVEEAQRCKLGGGTVIRAEQGFATKLRGINNRMAPVFFSGSSNLPLIIEIVDKRENLDRILPFLAQNGNKHFMACIGDIDVLVTDYIKKHADELSNVHDKLSKQ